MTATNRTYYQILNINPHASNDEVHRVCRQLSEKYHPDRVAHLDVILAKEYEQRMKEINEAKQVLCDPVARAKYNRKIKVFQPSYTSTATSAKKVEVLTMEVIEDQELELQCPACSEKFQVTKKACQDFVQCPACGKKGSLGDEVEEEESEEHLLECPGCKKPMRIPGNVVPNETLIECPYCGSRGTIG